mgnify:FL=1
MLLYPNVHDDDRGYFSETFSLRDQAYTLPRFVQENESWTRRKGTLRGLHFQRGTSAQAKLVRCLTGAVRDVIVDIRAGSPTRFRWIAVELSAHDHTMLFIPKGFAHGFLTLTDDVLFQYKTDAYYDPASEGAVRWNDPTLAVAWGVEVPILSPKDAAAPFLEAANLG